jgi:hypothetical protein
MTPPRTRGGRSSTATSADTKKSASKSTSKQPSKKRSTTKSAQGTASNPKPARKAASAPKAAPRPAAKAAEVARHVAQQLAALIRKDPGEVTQLVRSDDGWSVHVEVLELRRIPETMDMMALYEVTADHHGDVEGYRRLRRYVRGVPGDE